MSRLRDLFSGDDAREAITTTWIGCRVEGEEVETVSEPLPWRSGEAYPETEGSIGSREVVE